MPPTIKVSKDRIVDTAYQLTKDKGFDCVTARKLAKEIGCSTQPIFRVYPGMDELKKEVRARASEEFSSRLSASLVADPQMYATLLNVGVMYVDFAIQQPNLFRMLFMEEGSRFEDMLYGRELKSIL
ncbi:MAG: TetR/AcrR family transcriptional regulator, partial [Lachnospiraceae bacterium]|nr:TetR/AcrR family transcriptional regulator [Lachnospiraceae bacterium]